VTAGVGSRIWRPVQPENDFLRQVVALAELWGWAVYHTWRSQHSQAGFPDLVLCKPPRLVFAELKREYRGRASPRQAVWLSLLRACPGVESYLWKPSHWPQIERVLGAGV
jgi:hypothetical protein